MPGLRVGWAVAPTDVIERIWRAARLHDAHTGRARATVSPRSRWNRRPAIASSRARAAIIRANLPAARGVARARSRPCRAIRPVAGAIVFAKVDLPMPTIDLVERIRAERSVLLVPGEMFGIENGIRFGFGFDIEHTLKGLALVGETLADVATGL